MSTKRKSSAADAICHLDEAHSGAAATMDLVYEQDNSRAKKGFSLRWAMIQIGRSKKMFAA